MRSECQREDKTRNPDKRGEGKKGAVRNGSKKAIRAGQGIKTDEEYIDQRSNSESIPQYTFKVPVRPPAEENVTGHKCRDPNNDVIVEPFKRHLYRYVSSL